MKCPACERKVDNGAWICPFCEYILDPSFLDGHSVEEESQERTAIIAWSAPEEDQNEYPDAVILGDVGVSEDEFEMVHGAGAETNGRTSTFLFYTAGSSTRVLHPNAVPRLRSEVGDLPRTPYEDFILSCVDGQRTVRQIQKTSGLAPQEVVVTLLTLLDKGAVIVETMKRDPKTEAKLKAEEEARRAKRARAKARRQNRRTPRSSPNTPVVDSQASLPKASSSYAAAQESDYFESSRSRDIVAPSVLKDAQRPSPESDNWPTGSDEESPTQLRSAEEVSAELHQHMASLHEPEEPTGPSQESWRKFRGDSSYSDVWAPLDAEPLVENEVSDREPRPLSASALLELSDPSPPAESEDVTKEVFIPSEIRENLAPVNPPADPTQDVPHLRSRAQSAMVAPVDRPPSDTPMLDPAFLRPATPSDASRGIPSEFFDDEGADFSDLGTRDDGPDINFSANPSVRAALPSVEPISPPRAQTRGVPTSNRRIPIQELDRRRDPPSEHNAERPSERSEPQTNEPPDPAPTHRAVSPPPVDSMRMMKAQKLFDQALKDKAEGNLVSARMNMKLALTFDPSNKYVQDAFDELSKNPDAQVASKAGGRSRAREYYDAATEAENNGDVDRAVELLEKAIKESKQPAFYNRLGVILAMKRKEFGRAQELIEKAIELAPGNITYEKNLQKILQRAALDAGGDESKEGAAGKLGGLLGFLGRKK